MIWLAKRKLKSTDIKKRLEGIAELERAAAAGRSAGKKEVVWRATEPLEKSVVSGR
jgi:hypothetical protein